MNPGPKGTSVRVVERPGTPLMRGIAVNIPFPLPQCGREDCPLSIHGGECNDRCRLEGVVYRAACQICIRNQDGIPSSNRYESFYEGETSRPVYTRALQHLADYRKAARNSSSNQPQVENDPKSSWMWDHVRDIHNGEIDLVNPALDFKFSVISSHREPMERQIKEAIMIEAAFRGTVASQTSNESSIFVKCLNRKGEHFAPIERYNKDGVNV